jgi:hypothetical protein
LFPNRHRAARRGDRSRQRQRPIERAFGNRPLDRSGGPQGSIAAVDWTRRHRSDEWATVRHALEHAERHDGTRTLRQHARLLRADLVQGERRRRRAPHLGSRCGREGTGTALDPVGATGPEGRGNVGPRAGGAWPVSGELEGERPLGEILRLGADQRRRSLESLRGLKVPAAAEVALGKASGPERGRRLERAALFHQSHHPGFVALSGQQAGEAVTHVALARVGGEHARSDRRRLEGTGEPGGPEVLHQQGPGERLHPIGITEVRRRRLSPALIARGACETHQRRDPRAGRVGLGLRHPRGCDHQRQREPGRHRSARHRSPPSSSPCSSCR